jgi:type VI protein secretion system component VasK
MVLAADWQVGEVLWTFVWFTLFFIWIWLAISVFIDIFRSHDMGGWHKAIWILFIVLLPYLGVLVYLIARGGKMQAHAVEAAKQQDAAAKEYIREAAGTPASPVDELHRLADLKERGVIDDAEFQSLKAKTIGDATSA